MPFHHHVLANGLTIVGETSPSARSAAVGFFVRTGRAMNRTDVCGVSHFLEHMVFKGTPNRTSLDVNRDFDKIGASYNAFTSEENTVFYAAILPEYLPQAVDILADILRRACAATISRWRRRSSSKRSACTTISRCGAPTTTPRKRSSPSIRWATASWGPPGASPACSASRCRRTTIAVTSRRTSPSRSPATSPGPTWSALAEKHCGRWPGGEAPAPGVRPAPATQAEQAIPRAKIHQEHVLLCCRRSGPPDTLRYAADTLAMVIGDDSGQPLSLGAGRPGPGRVGRHDVSTTTKAPAPTTRR